MNNNDSVNDLMERYIYAVVRRLPHKVRGDVEQELRSLIEDMLEARCGELAPAEKDLRVVLAELGSPGELAAKYSPDKSNTLIGPAYFPTYKLVLKIVVLCVVFGLLVAYLVKVNTDPGGAWYMAVWDWFTGTVMGLSIAFSWVTLIFAIFQWRGVRLDTEDALANLPEVPKKNERIGVAAPIAGMVFSVVFTVLFLAMPQLIGGWFEGTGWLPVFNVDVLRSRWVIVLLLGILGVGSHSFELYEGRRTARLAAATIAIDILSAGLFIGLFSGTNLVNQDFLSAFATLDGVNQGSTFLRSLMTNANNWFLGLILFGIVVSIIDTVWETYKARR